MFKKYKQNKEIARAMSLYITYSILGPLLVIGGIGYVIDRILDTRLFLLISIFVAYGVSNILMFKKLKKINLEVEKNSPPKKDGEKNVSSPTGYDDLDDDYNEVWPVNNSTQKEDIKSEPDSNFKK